MTNTTNTKKKSRIGYPKYTETDTDKLIDIVEEIEPIGNNEWCRVASMFIEYASENHRPLHDAESVKGKLDRLENRKKPKGDTYCPAPVCRVKRIARAIHRKVNAISIGVDTSEKGHDADVTIAINESVLGSDVTTGSKRKSPVGATVGA